VVGGGTVPVGAVAKLFAYDAAQATELVQALRRWLEALGDVPAAAAAAYVHPNTFRYRLRRLAQIGEFDLDDPDERFAALVQLRLLALREGSAGDTRRNKETQ